MLWPLNGCRGFIIVGIHNPKLLFFARLRIMRNKILIADYKVVVLNVEYQTISGRDLSHEFSYIVGFSSTLNGCVFGRMDN